MFTVTISSQLNNLKKNINVHSNSTIRDVVDDYISIYKDQYFVLCHKLKGLDADIMKDRVVDGSKFHKKWCNMFPKTTTNFILVLTFYRY